MRVANVFIESNASKCQACITPPGGDLDSFYFNFSHIQALVFMTLARDIHSGMQTDLVKFKKRSVHENK